MSYFERLIAIARDDEPASVAAIAAESAPVPVLVEEHAVADRSPERPSTPRTTAPVTAREARDAAAAVPDVPDMPAAARGVPAERAAMLPPQTPPQRLFVSPVPHARDSVHVEPARRDMAIRIESAPPTDSVVSRTDHASRTAPADAPSPAPSEAPGLRALRDVMNWIGQPPEERAPARPAPPMPTPVEAPPRGPAIVEIHGAPSREVATSSARGDDDRPIEVSIGEIEVTVEAPAMTAPTVPQLPRRRIVTRDTRLARRLPRSG